ncbi:MAG: thioredoxin family protein [Xenophilus sp.]
MPPTPPPVSDAPWVVCLCAEWCGTCRDYRPLMRQVAQAHPQMRFAWVDIEDHADLADDFDVETFPTLLVADAGGQRFLGPLLPNGQALSRLLGALPAAQPLQAHVRVLVEGIERDPAAFALRPD